MTRTPEIWPPLLTPFDDKGRIDFEALRDLVEFNVGQGVSGLLVTGLSAEPFEMTEEERLSILRHCVDTAGGRVRIAAAVFPEGPSDWRRVITAAHAAGAETAVLLTAYLAEENAPEAAILAALDDIIATTEGDLGLYEAPRPFKRLLSDEAVALAAASGRFTFYKDTCLDPRRISRRAGITAGTRLQLLNAEMASFRQSMASGADGFCGLMANVYPGSLALAATQQQDSLSLLLTAADAALEKNYPSSAKLLLARREGLGLDSYARTRGQGTTEQDCSSLFAADTLIRRHLATTEC